MSNKITGLSSDEVARKQSAGLTNQSIDSTSPSYGRIVLRNTFNLINIALIPLLIALSYFDRYKDVFIMSVFLVVNSLIGMADEARIKRRLDQIQVQFAKKVRVIRDGREQEILGDELVRDDIVKVIEGEGIPTDGEVVLANNLQVDESLLTGESNYLVREEQEEVLGGSFVVTGECIYRVTHVGKESYINKIGFQSRAFRKEKSNLQRIGDKLTIAFVVSSVVFGAITYVSAISLQQPASVAVVPLTSVVSLIIPQTLIFLFTFTFSISVLRLSNVGVLVRRGSAVESLAKLDALCFDKTGTITSGDLEVTATKFWQIEQSEIAKSFNFLNTKAFGRNKTFETIVQYFRSHSTSMLAARELTQIPFNSKTKQARNQFALKGGKHILFVYGAPPTVLPMLTPELRAQAEPFLAEEENKGRRLILGLVAEAEDAFDLQNPKLEGAKLGAWAISMKEQLNPGIAQTISDFHRLGTELKIISGDSFQAITRILEGIGVDIGKAVDLSAFDGKLAEAALQYNIFARAKPEDKLVIIKSLQAQGKLVGMVGDGVNDVLAIKLANLSIAVESGAKITQDVADIVLLKNNFNLIPTIIYEGENVVANLKFMNLLFLTKTIHALSFAAACAAFSTIFPMLPASILIYSFMATSLPSYAIAFFRREVRSGKKFWSEVLPSSILAGVIGAIVSLAIFKFFATANPLDTNVNTLTVYGTLGFALLYSVYQLYKGGFVVKWWQLILTYVVISLVSFAATLIPFISTYYDVTNIGINNWLTVYVVGAVGFLAYLLLEKPIYYLSNKAFTTA